MDPTRRQTLIERHREALALHGATTDALFWASRGQQRVRFKVLSEIGIGTGDSLLDVGCGFAELADWLHAHGLDVEYTGLDLSPEILAVAARRHPQVRLACGELFDLDAAPLSYDWVVLSGTLNWQLHDGGAYARRAIARMFELCRFGVAFNMLDARAREHRRLEELVAFDAGGMLDYCTGIAPDSQCRSDYLDGDFTIYMRRTG